MKPLTILEIVRQAAEATGTLDKDAVVTHILREKKHEISPIRDIFRAIETLRTGKEYESNLKTPGFSNNKNISRKEFYDLRKEHGLCVECGFPAASGKVMCQQHLDMKNQLAKAKREKQKQEAANG